MFKKGNLKKLKRPPHYKVYTRLMPSKIDGVGVFAIRNIPKNTNIFGRDCAENEENNFIDEKKIDKINPALKKLYDDFCTVENNYYNCPKNFNLLTVSWYVNHSGKPNVVHGEDGNFISLREIKKGEELTVNYKTFSDEPPHDWL